MPVTTHKLAPTLQGQFGTDDHVFAKGPLVKRDWTRLAKLRDQQVLTLSGVRADSLDFLANWTKLRSLRFYGCIVGDYSALARLKRLDDLFLNGIRTRTADLTFLGQLTRLENLGIAGVPHLTAFPDLSRCTRLKRLSIHGCKRLCDLSSIVQIPNLESFGITGTLVQPADLEPIMAMPTIKLMSGAFGRVKLNAEFRMLMAKHGVAYG
jgi:hypothetical protein